jgi:death-on-curing protein
MREPVWVRDDVVRAIHLRQLAEHGGAQGVRDAGLLDSALARPKNLWAYSDPKPDLAALGAAYAFGVVKNHPFVDGNKRTGYVLLRTFLLINGRDIEATQEEKYRIFLSLADGTLDEAGLTDWVRGRLSGVKRQEK